MGKWAGKYVIGLTGNIGTGKSVVRRMLEHLGAFGIDADALSHRAIAKGAPGYAKVVDTFGRWVLGPDGEVDRAKLGRVVFSDPAALAQLEAIIHPLVRQAVDWMIQRSSKQVVVVEAIKLLESPLREGMDSIWVVASPMETQLARLMQKRGMTEAEARQRITTQPRQEQKIAAANVVIRNVSTFVDTWKQVASAWQKTVPGQEKSAAVGTPVSKPAATAQSQPVKSSTPAPQALNVTRGRPRDAENIAGLLNRLQNTNLTSDDIMAEFGEKAFLLLHADDRLVGAAGWQVENLVARIGEIVLESNILPDQALPLLISEMERASRDLQCEAALIFTTSDLTDDKVWKGLGYERRTPQSLGVSVWQEAAKETLKPGLTLYFKQLRQDRVLRPI